MSDERSPGFNHIIHALPSTTPFIAPETLERQSGRRFKARLGANESLFGPSPLALAAMRSALEDIGLYGDPESHNLRLEIASRESVSPEQIIVGAGIDDLLGLFVRILLNPGEALVASLGSYPTVAFHVAGYGARLESVPYRDFHNDLDALSEAARRVRARVVYLANPDNPTGSWYEGKDVAALLGRLPDDCALLLDEAYTELAPVSARASLPQDDNRLIRLRTFSKAYGMAGARIGYALASHEVARMSEKVRLHFGVNRIAQAGALASLQDQDYLRGVVREIARGREDYAELARELGFTPLRSSTNFVAMDTGSSERSRLIVQGLLARDIFIRAPVVEGLNHLIRVSVGDAERRALFAASLRDVCWTLNDAPRA
jgi:histidinol-phosphate aminotransferase